MVAIVVGTVVAVAMVMMTIAGHLGGLLTVGVVIILLGIPPMVEDQGGTGPGPLILLAVQGEPDLPVVIWWRNNGVMW